MCFVSVSPAHARTCSLSRQKKNTNRYEYYTELAGGKRQWFRAYGNENWEFDEGGFMRKRVASINDAPIDESERRVAVEDGKGGMPPRNEWLDAQGVTKAGGEFPFGGGSAAAY